MNSLQENNSQNTIPTPEVSGTSEVVTSVQIDICNINLEGKEHIPELIGELIHTFEKLSSEYKGIKISNCRGKKEMKNERAKKKALDEKIKAYSSYIKFLYSHCSGKPYKGVISIDMVNQAQHYVK